MPVALLAAALLLPACRPEAGADRPSTVSPAARVVLVTGFEPFGGDPLNASWEAVRELDGRELAGCRIVVRQLPVVWGKPMEVLPGLLDELRPAAVFAFGQGRPGGFTFERVGRNARKPFKDNLGRRPGRPTVVPDGPDQLRSPFPMNRLMPALQGAGLPVGVSENAGQYLCDETTYALEYLRRSRANFECAFFHVPPLGTKLIVSGREAACDRELLLSFVVKVVESWAALPPPGSESN